MISLRIDRVPRSRLPVQAQAPPPPRPSPNYNPLITSQLQSMAEIARISPFAPDSIAKLLFLLGVVWVVQWARPCRGATSCHVLLILVTRPCDSPPPLRQCRVFPSIMRSRGARHRRSQCPRPPSRGFSRVRSQVELFSELRTPRRSPAPRVRVGPVNWRGDN
jgi:hypothetical protein